MMLALKPRVLTRAHTPKMGIRDTAKVLVRAEIARSDSL
jgi:hypothetical protein